jgi:hypothetical protein
MHGFSALAIDQAFFANDPAELAQLEVPLKVVFSNLDVPKKTISPSPKRRVRQSNRGEG